MRLGFSTHFGGRVVCDPEAMGYTVLAQPDRAKTVTAYTTVALKRLGLLVMDGKSRPSVGRCQG